MDKIENLIQSLESFLHEQNHYIEEAIKRNSAIIVESNVFQMYELGQKRTGKSITPPYSPAYKKVKQRKGQRTDHVTLRDTGAFHASLYVDYFNEGFEIKAKDFKTPFLVNRYSPDILGLKDDSLKAICDEFITPYLRQRLFNLIRK